MKINLNFVLSLLLLFVILPSCVVDDGLLVEGDVQGLKPIYADANSITSISLIPPIPLENPGKIFLKDNMIYINELRKGVHIINNTDPTNPLPVGFIEIPGNVDIASKGDVFYFDNYRDLIAIKFDSFNEITVVKRIENLFPETNQYPDEFGIYFECVDESKGIVVGWEPTTITNPQCYR